MKLFKTSSRLRDYGVLKKKSSKVTGKHVNNNGIGVAHDYQLNMQSEWNDGHHSTGSELAMDDQFDIHVPMKKSGRTSSPLWYAGSHGGGHDDHHSDVSSITTADGHKRLNMQQTRQNGNNMQDSTTSCCTTCCYSTTTNDDRRYIHAMEHSLLSDQSPGEGNGNDPNTRPRFNGTQHLERIQSQKQNVATAAGSLDMWSCCAQPESSMYENIPYSSRQGAHAMTRHRRMSSAALLAKTSLFDALSMDDDEMKYGPPKKHEPNNLPCKKNLGWGIRKKLTRWRSDRNG
jgi:hypothetical protein